MQLTLFGPNHPLAYLAESIPISVSDPRMALSHHCTLNLPGSGGRSSPVRAHQVYRNIKCLWRRPLRSGRLPTSELPGPMVHSPTRILHRCQFYRPSNPSLPCHTQSMPRAPRQAPTPHPLSLQLRRHQRDIMCLKIRRSSNSSSKNPRLAASCRSTLMVTTTQTVTGKKPNANSSPTVARVALCHPHTRKKASFHTSGNELGASLGDMAWHLLVATMSRHKLPTCHGRIDHP